MIKNRIYFKKRGKSRSVNICIYCRWCNIGERSDQRH